MFRFLFKVIFVMILGVLIYNYFFGTPEEKATSKEIATKAKDLTTSVFNFAKSEKQKFDKGKYDSAVDKLNEAYNELRNNENKMTDAEKKNLDKLKKEKEALQRQIDEAAKKDQKEADKMTKSLDQKLFDLIKKFNTQADQLEEK